MIGIVFLLLFGSVRVKIYRLNLILCVDVGAVAFARC